MKLYWTGRDGCVHTLKGITPVILARLDAEGWIGESATSSPLGLAVRIFIRLHRHRHQHILLLHGVGNEQIELSLVSS
jgi:hypothetical protein